MSFNKFKKELKKLGKGPGGIWLLVCSIVFGALALVYAYDSGTWGGLGVKGFPLIGFILSPLFVLATSFLPPFPRLFAMIRLARWNVPEFILVRLVHAPVRFAINLPLWLLNLPVHGLNLFGVRELFGFNISPFALVEANDQWTMIVAVSALVCLMVYLAVQWFPSVIKRFLFGAGVGMVGAIALFGINIMDDLIGLPSPLGDQFYILLMLVLMSLSYFIANIQKSRKLGWTGGKKSK